MKKKCIIVCNGPTVSKMKDLNKNDYDGYDIIAVNRWNNVFEQVGVPRPPDIVIIGKNSFDANIQNINNLPNTKFYGTEPLQYYLRRYGLPQNIKIPNYAQLTFNKEYPTALWWSGIYCLQYALRNNYDEIIMFGFTCTDHPDFKNTMIREPIPKQHFERVVKYFQYLKDSGKLGNVIFHENRNNHPIFSRLK